MIGDSGQVSDPVGSGTVLAVALSFFALGCVMLAVAGPSLAALHAFAAFITLSIVAAANQLVPVLGGGPPASPRLVIVFSLPLALGFVLLICALEGAPVGGGAGVLLTAGALAWIAWTGLRLMAGAHETSTRVAFGLALTSFGLAATLGAVNKGPCRVQEASSYCCDTTVRPNAFGKPFVSIDDSHLR